MRGPKDGTGTSSVAVDLDHCAVVAPPARHVQPAHAVRSHVAEFMGGPV